MAGTKCWPRICRATLSFSPGAARPPWAAAAKQGFRGILSNGYYLDLGWSAARHYVVDPMSGAAADLSPEEKLRILGGRIVHVVGICERRKCGLAHLAAQRRIAERLWSPQNVTDIPSMYARLDAESTRLERLGLTHKTYYPPRTAAPRRHRHPAGVRRLTHGSRPRRARKRLRARANRHLRAHQRHRLQSRRGRRPPRSDEGRRFANLVNQYLASSCHDEDAGTALRAQLVRWRDNDAQLAPLAQRSFLVNEIVPVSQDLTVMSKIGVSAMDYLILGSQSESSWKADQLAVLANLGKPKAQLLLMPLPSSQKLVEATSGPATCGGSSK